MQRPGKAVLYCLLLLCLTGNLVAGQKRLWTGFKHHVTFDGVSVEQGLSHNSVLCIMQDSDGFMWFGTEDGLNRYDGKEFTVFHPDPAVPGTISNNIIPAICEDHAGRIWVGTTGGGLNLLHRETDTFTAFRNSDESTSISGNDINRIFEDSKKRFWVCTNSGLNLMVPPGKGQSTPVFTVFLKDPGNPGSLGNNTVTCLYEDKTGGLWIGTSGGGLNRMEYAGPGGPPPTFTRFTSETHCPGNPGLDLVMDIDEDSSGMIWLGTQEGLFSFNRESGVFTPYTYSPDNPASIGGNYIRVVHKDRTGLLWIGTDGGGLNKLLPAAVKGEAPTFVRHQKKYNNPDYLYGNAVESIYEDRSGVLWVGVYHGGLNKLIFSGTEGAEREKEQFIHYQNSPSNPNSLSHNFVNALLQDKEQALWVGTDGGGLNRLVLPRKKGEPVTFHHYRNEPGNPHSLSDDIITAILQDSGGNIWFGTYTGGLDKLTPEALEIVARSTHTAVPGKPRFLHYRNEPGDKKTLSNNFVSTIIEDSRGNVWVGTVGGGLNKYNKESNDFTSFVYDDAIPTSIGDNNIFSMIEDRGGNLWIGTVEGLDRMVTAPDGKTRFIHSFHRPEENAGLSHNFVRVIYQDSRERVWVGTNGGGLNLMVPGPNGALDTITFKHYRDKDGLPNNVILGILEDDNGNLWLSTNKGISRFDPQKRTFKNYDIRDGLQSDEFCRGAFFKNRQGEMFFGGNNGFNIFHPDNIKESTYVPPIVITGFTVLNKPVPIGSPVRGKTILKKSITYTRDIELSYKDYVFSFSFAALHYANPARNSYAYMMEGLDEEWNYVKNRSFATYTTLLPGNYVFRVKGTNSDGVWNEKGAALGICITPPFWKTWWFYGLAVLALVMTILGTHIYRVRQLINRERRKYEKTSIRTEKADEYLNRLMEFIAKEKPYLNPDITLHKLAKMVDIPYHSLSQVINHKLNKIFFDFINHYRIEEAVKQLEDARASQKSIQQIAGEVGFNSQSAFNRAFKKHTRQTPSDFINRYRIEQAVKKLTDPEEQKKNIQQIANEVGFSSQSAFNRAFKNITGKTPSQFKKNKTLPRGFKSSQTFKLSKSKSKKT
ncbi:MAG: helix-turn-helix domain-containing protein [bacterium]|nr:helix-turn-helix domain-containing protein [bacterium]